MALRVAAEAQGGRLERFPLGQHSGVEDQAGLRRRPNAEGKPGNWIWDVPEVSSRSAVISTVRYQCNAQPNAARSRAGMRPAISDGLTNGNNFSCRPP